MQNILFFLDTSTESPLSSRNLLKKRHLCRLVKNAQMQGRSTELSVLSGQLSGLPMTPDNWQLKTDNCDEGRDERSRWAFFNCLLKT